VVILDIIVLQNQNRLKIMKFKNAVVGQRIIVKANYNHDNELIMSKNIAGIAIGREATIVAIDERHSYEKVKIRFDSTNGFDKYAAHQTSGWWVPHSFLKRI
jgi:hypothetical protein